MRDEAKKCLCNLPRNFTAYDSPCKSGKSCTGLVLSTNLGRTSSHVSLTWREVYLFSHYPRLLLCKPLWLWTIFLLVQRQQKIGSAGHDVITYLYQTYLPKISNILSYEKRFPITISSPTAIHQPPQRQCRCKAIITKVPL